MSNVKIDARAIYNGIKLNDQGQMDYSKFPKLIKKVGGSGITADQKLKYMLRIELEKMKRKEETNFDALDFRYEDDQQVELHPAVETEMVTQEDVRKAWHENRKKQKQSSGGEAPAARKSAQTDPPQGGGNTKSKSKSSSPAPTEGEDETDE